MAKVPIEVLLSARLFVNPKTWQDTLFFISNMGQGGHFSLYSMQLGGSLPQPLLPPHVALQNPSLMNGDSFVILGDSGKILLMLDRDGDENYQPMFIPLEGGLPEAAFGDHFAGFSVSINHADQENNLVYFTAEGRVEEIYKTYQANLVTGGLTLLSQDTWGNFVDGVSPDNRRVTLNGSYAVGDNVLYEWQPGQDKPRVLYGLPLEERAADHQVELNSVGGSSYTESGRGLLLVTSLFEDTFGLGYLDLDKPGEILPVTIRETVHSGVGEFMGYQLLSGSRYLLQYNIDGCSWVYEGQYDENTRELKLDRVICGQGQLSNGVLESIHYDKEADRYALAFSTAISPCQLYTVEGPDRKKITVHTNERILGVPQEWLSPGEDASFTSFDGLRVSARLYLPAPVLGSEGKRPLVYYIHGGPQSQERPDFTWFSMPLIQFLTLNGFAVFVPNVRGSTGYGLSYTKRVDRDWGGQDRQDHLHAMKLLAEHPQVDVTRSAVIGRSYGGYMTLTLASRHPELWKAAADMFGPYDLANLVKSAPITWRAYFALTIGDPEKEPEFLRERSPQTYLGQIQCPLLVIQGKNDPRVIESESRDLVEHLRALGKEVDYLMFEDEGHDVLKFANRVKCYNRLTDFFLEHL